MEDIDDSLESSIQAAECQNDAAGVISAVFISLIAVVCSLLTLQAVAWWWHQRRENKVILALLLISFALILAICFAPLILHGSLRFTFALSILSQYLCCMGTLTAFYKTE